MSSTSVYPSSNSTNITDDTSDVLDNRTELLWKICGPILLIIGVPGNLATIVILHSIANKSISFIFFRALGITDLLLLLTPCMFTWIKYQFGTDPEDTGKVMCVLSKLVGYTMGKQSAFILMLLTAHRAFVTVQPCRAINMCTRQRVHLAIAAVFIISFISCLYIPLTLEIREGKCEWTESFNDNAIDVIGWVNAMFFSIIPATVIVISNFLIIQKLRESARKVAAGAGTTHTHVTNKISRVTLSVILLSVVFILLSFPLTVLNLIRQYNRELFGDPDFKFSREIAKVLYYLYCVATVFATRGPRNTSGRKQNTASPPRGSKGVGRGCL